MKDKKKIIIQLLSEFTTDVLIMNEDSTDPERLAAQELKLEKAYAAKILKAITATK